MRDEFQAIEWAEPPIGDLVDGAVAKGRQMRTMRRVRVGAAGLAVLAVTGLAASLAVNTTAAPVAVVAAPPAASTTARVAGADAGRVTGTPAGLLELLVQNLPKGRTSHHAGAVQDGDVTLQTYLDRGDGPGLVTLSVMTRKASAFAGLGTWIPLGNGTEYMVKKVPGNCVQHTIVWVHHADDTLLQFGLSTCLTGKDGQTEKTARSLTAREAAEVGADSRWGVKIDPALNQQGAADFPNLPAVR